MNINEVRKAVGKLKASLFKNANSYSIGSLKTNFRGTGLQFKEHQVYTFGDDVRFIDWKILAKTNNPYVKTFEEERNVEIVVVIDAGPTMLTGYKGISKLQASIEICCLLYLISKETNDKVHALILSDKVIHIPKKSGDEGISYLISSLENENILNHNGKINHEREFKNILSKEEKNIAIMKHLNRKREIVLLSDFNDFVEVSSLKKILYRSHVHCFQVLSPIDEAEKTPFSIFASGSQKSSGSLGLYDFSGERKDLNIFGKKFKKLRVCEKYLDNFIKEMV